MKILIAEDNPDVRNLYKKVLTHRGHRLTLTKNGQECLDEFNANFDENSQEDCPYDLVLLDYNMPELTGLEVEKEIHKKMPKQPVAYASAYPDNLVTALQKNNLNTEIYPKFSTLESFLNFVEQVRN